MISVFDKFTSLQNSLKRSVKQVLNMCNMSDKGKDFGHRMMPWLPTPVLIALVLRLLK